MNNTNLALALSFLILCGCESAPPQKQIHEENILGFEYFQPNFVNVEIPIPKNSLVEEGYFGAVINGDDYQFSVREIGMKFSTTKLEEIVSNICSLSRNKTHEKSTVLYEVKNETGQWIRFETKCPRMEAARDIMIARIGTGTLLLTILDGTSEEMAQQIEQEFLKIKWK